MKTRIHKVAIALFWLTLASTSCFAQTSYQGLTPGKSIRADVDRLLGQAVKEHSPTLIEYRPNQQNQSKIYVQYRKDSPIIERIEVLLIQPMSRSHVLGLLQLPEQSTASRVNASGNLEEYFGSVFYVVLTYQGVDTRIGVIRTGRYSRELFESALAKTSSGTEEVQSKNPYDKERLLTVVRLNALPKQEIVQAIEQRGVDFQTNPAVEAEFRQAGESTEVIEAIHANYNPPVFSVASADRSGRTLTTGHNTCLSSDPGAGVKDRNVHYNWAQQQTSERLAENLESKLGKLFQCPSLGDDQLANAFADISVLIAKYVPDANCFGGNRGVIGTNFSVHRDWARARSRQDVLNNLQSKVSAAMRCLDRNRQLDFFADVSASIARSGA